MSTRKFVSIMVVALVVFVAVVSSVAFAVAEENSVYTVNAVVVSYETTPWGDLEIEVVDEEGNLCGYYADADEDVHIGDVVTLVICDFGSEELNEIVNVIRIGHLDVHSMVQWLIH